LDAFSPESAQQELLSRRVASGLRRAIVLGLLAPGVHLHEPQLAQKFGVSRMPIREALAQLEHEGLVRAEPHRGTFVLGMTLRDIEEVYDVRRLLEVAAGRLAAARATAEAIEELQELVGRMAAFVAAGQRDLVGQVDIVFHRRLITSAAHRRLLANWEPLAGIAECLLTETDQVRDTELEVVQAHQAIVDALSARDPDAAAAHIEHHLRDGARVMQRVHAEARASVAPLVS
jgi:DNA-binding GntR family transcriptional regulator